MKKIVSIFLALLLIIGLVPMGLAEEKPVITIAVQDKVNVEDYNTNLQTLQLEEACGVDIQFMVFPATDYTTKLNLMFSAGGAELPDVIFANPNYGELLNWIDSGMLLPLNDYFADPNKAPNIYFNIKDIGFDFTKQIVMPDGNIYFIPTFTQSQSNETPHKAWYNQTWLDALDAESPTTPDELYDLFVKVKNTDLNGNGKNDEIGLVGNMDSYKGWFQYIMNAFIYAGDSKYLVVEDGVVTVAYTKPEWQEGLKFIRKLFAEDLIPKEILTQDDQQYLAMLNSELCTTMMLVYTSPSRVNAALDWRNDFICYQPLINEEFGGPLASYRPSTVPNGNCFFITKNCKNPDAAFKLGDTIVSRHFVITTRWGQEGQDWDYIENVPNADEYVAAVDGFDKLMLIYNDAQFWSSGEVQNRSWMNAGPAIRSYGVANGRAIKPDAFTDFNKHSNGGAVLYSENVSWLPTEVIPKLTYNSEEAAIISDLESTLDTFVDEWTANFLVGNLDLDKDWDTYVKELEAIGIEQYVEIVQRVYDRMYK
ncbi:MAG: extracellular solute-binding protein [Clostridiales bacterium]|nr:extracellular solute-binding protein [Clostridiales bacterium]